MLSILTHVTDIEYKNLMAFNKIRNDIVHKIFHEPYEKQRRDIRDKNIDTAFKAGKKLAETLEIKTHEELECGRDQDAD